MKKPRKGGKLKNKKIKIIKKYKNKKKLKNTLKLMCLGAERHFQKM